MSGSLFPPVAFDLIDNAEADEALARWGHWLGGCNRPFGRQSYGLVLLGELVAVAVSASTVNATCGGMPRGELVELARLCSAPLHRDMTRVALRLWRKVAREAWEAKYWQVRCLVSYQNAVRHSGNLYRFDGWTRLLEVKSSGPGSTWGVKQPRRAGDRKVIWAWPLDDRTRDEVDRIAASAGGGA